MNDLYFYIMCFLAGVGLVALFDDTRFWWRIWRKQENKYYTPPIQNMSKYGNNKAISSNLCMNPRCHIMREHTPEECSRWDID